MIKMIIADYEGDDEERDRQDKRIHSIEEFLLSFNPPADFVCPSFTKETLLKFVSLKQSKKISSYEENIKKNKPWIN